MSKSLYLLLSLNFLLLISCKTEVEEKLFQEEFKKLSDKRISFRLNMKALGDSSFAHQEFAEKVMSDIATESEFERKIESNYLAYNDSLKSELEKGKVYFYQQWVSNKPLISTLEKSDMKFDNILQEMKNGELSESEGLDSLKAFSKIMDNYINQSETLVKESSDRYWDFRKTFEEYKYNMKNLKYLYASKLK